MVNFQEILFVDKIFGIVVCNILILLYLVKDQFLWIIIYLKISSSIISILDLHI